MYYYETNNTTSSDEYCIIGLIDNYGGGLSINTIDGKEVKMGGALTANKSFVIKTGYHKINLRFESANGSGYMYSNDLVIEGNFSAGIVYLVNPIRDGSNLYLKVYEGDKLDNYNLSNMDINHFTAIYKNILAEKNK